MSWEDAQRAACMSWPDAGKAGPTLHSVYCVIAGHADKKTHRWQLSMETIADEGWCSVRAARDAVRELEKLGAIWVTRFKGRVASIYEINTAWTPPNTAEAAALQPAQPGNKRHPTRQITSPNPAEAAALQDHIQDHLQSSRAREAADAVPARSLTPAGLAHGHANGREGHEHEARQGQRGAELMAWAVGGMLQVGHRQSVRRWRRPWHYSRAELRRPRISKPDPLVIPARPQSVAEIVAALNAQATDAERLTMHLYEHQRHGKPWDPAWGPKPS